MVEVLLVKDVLIIGVALFFGCTLSALIGGHLGRTGAHLQIARDCSADGQFTIMRGDTRCVFTCSKPKLGLIEPWE